MKILVTGYRGQLGRGIVNILDKKYDLILTDIHNMNITDIEQVRFFIKKNIPDYIIHGAAYTKVDQAESEIDVCRNINSVGTENLAKVAKEFDIKVIYISTDFVFDGNKGTAYIESDIKNPLSVYGLTKHEGEEHVMRYCDKYYIIRTSWLFGLLKDVDNGVNFIETIINLSKQKDVLNIIDDQIGSPTYVKDLVETISIFIDKEPEYGIYHFSGIGECSWFDFAKEIFKQLNIDIEINPIKTIDYRQKAKRPMYSYLDKNKIEKKLDIKVRNWKDMLKDYLLDRSM